MEVSDIEQAKKVNFSDWLKTKTINDILDKDAEQLIGELTEYSQNKLEQNGNKGEGSGEDGGKTD